MKAQTLPQVVMFEKRRDHGAHRIVSVPVPETSFFLRAAADGRKGRDAKRNARAAFMFYVRERGTNVRRRKETGRQK